MTSINQLIPIVSVMEDVVVNLLSSVLSIDISARAREKLNILAQRLIEIAGFKKHNFPNQALAEAHYTRMKHAIVSHLQDPFLFRGRFELCPELWPIPTPELAMIDGQLSSLYKVVVRDCKYHSRIPTIFCSIFRRNDMSEVMMSLRLRRALWYNASS